MLREYYKMHDAECLILKKDKEILLETLKDILNNDLKDLNICPFSINMILKSNDPVTVLNYFGYKTEYVNYDDVDYIEISDFEDGIIFVRTLGLFKRIAFLIEDGCYIEFEDDDGMYKLEFDGKTVELKKGTIVYE